jgi:hypothetical protein
VVPRLWLANQNPLVIKEKLRKGLSLNVKGKNKVIPVLFLSDHHTMKAYWGVEV